MEGNNPYAAGGGGWGFENLVAVRYAATMLDGSISDLGGRIEKIGRQSETPGFDDIRLTFEASNQGLKMVDIQCRRRQSFTRNDRKFQKLIAFAIEVVNGDAEFSEGHRGLAIVVDTSSPSHKEMRELCDLARASDDLATFLMSVERRRGAIAGRWSHVTGAAEQETDETLYTVLKSIHIRAVDLESDSSPDHQILIKDLASLWSPKNHEAASQLLDALFKVFADLNREAGSVDAHGLRVLLGPSAPPVVSRGSRRERIKRLLQAGESRIAGVLVALGVDESLASTLAFDIVNLPVSVTPQTSLTLITGEIGSGKSTELERHYRLSLLTALENPREPLPVFISAQRLRVESLEASVTRETDGIGDPYTNGVRLFIDGLDEAVFEIEDLLPDLRTLLAKMPDSIAMLTSRANSSSYHGEVFRIEPISIQESDELIRRLRLDGLFHVHGRPERVELLQRPLFAIQYALNGSQRTERLTEARLIREIGERVTSTLTHGAFESLVALAVEVVHRNGVAVRGVDIGLSPPEESELIRSRLVLRETGGLRFQLAALTEWFASFAIHKDSNLLDLSTSSPRAAWRWRYVHAQALLQASAEGADRVMLSLTSKSPATAAWVLNEARGLLTSALDVKLSGSSLDPIRQRVIRADAAWFQAVSIIGAEGYLSAPKTQTAIHLDRGRISIATKPSCLERFDGSSLGRSSVPHGWQRVRSGEFSNDGKWVWDWTFKEVKDRVDDWLKGGAGLETISSAALELAYHYAHTIMGTNPLGAPGPIELGNVEARVESYRRRIPKGEVRVASSNSGWLLSEAESFIGMLRSQGLKRIINPWPDSDQKGGWSWDFWSTGQLLRRVEVVTRTALNIYQEVVETKLSALKPLLSTYAILPGKVVGTFVAANSEDGWAGQPSLNWHIEPLPRGERNSSMWEQVEAIDRIDSGGWAELAKKFMTTKGEEPPPITFTTYGGGIDLYGHRPASALALKLVHDDLKRLEWSNSLIRFEDLPPLAPIHFEV